MSLLRWVLVGIVAVCCTGFVPVSGCAKGCGRVASSSGDDFARVGVRSSSYGDDLARAGSRTGRYDDLAGAGRYRAPVVVPVPVGQAGHIGDDLAHLSRSSLDDSLAALPEAQGGINPLARKPTSKGAQLDGLETEARTFSKDYAASVDELTITEKQHEGLMDAFEAAQDVAEQIIDALGEDDDSDPKKIAAAAKARETLQLTALHLEAELAVVLTPRQMQQFRTQFGSSELLVYRLAKEQPVARKTKPAKRAGTTPRDKVAP